VNRPERSPEATQHRETLARYVTPLLDPSHSLRARRHAMDALSAFAPPVPGVEIEEVDRPEVTGEWLVVGRPDPGQATLFYLHGGGYSLGSPFSHRPLVANLAEVTGSRIFSIAYRRAPEHPCPAALEDALRGWRWFLEQDVDPRRVFVAGDSAGGGLALAMLGQLVREGGSPMPAGLVLLSPWTDLALTGESLERNAGHDVTVSWPVLRRFAADYLAGLDSRDPRASPLYADLHGFPPMLIQAGGEEMLLSDATRLADRARSSGVEVVLDIAPGMWHVWQAWARQMPEAHEALERVAAFINHRLPRRH